MSKDKMRKALVISVGTGIGGNKEVIESLANGISYSIKLHNPSKVVFIVTEESKKTTVPKVIEKTGLENYEIKEIKDMDDVELIYSDVKSVLKNLSDENFSPENIVVDYTSGTKAMSVGTAFAAFSFGVEVLNYISGKREKGVVVSGTEKPVTIRPYKILIENELKTVASLFNTYQFDACLKILSRLKKLTREGKIQEKLNFCEKLCKLYSAWDKFDHNKAFEILRSVEGYSQNKEFLGKLINIETKEAFYIADLLSNSRRRYKEGKFDDGIARLYRVTELIAQYRLRRNFGLDTSNLDLGKIPAESRRKYEILGDGDGKIKLGLVKSYELLNDLGDELGKKFIENNRLQNLLTKRNESILAHGFTPIRKETFDELYKIVSELARDIVPNIDELIERSKFPPFEDNEAQNILPNSKH